MKAARWTVLGLLAVSILVLDVRPRLRRSRDRTGNERRRGAPAATDKTPRPTSTSRTSTRSTSCCRRSTSIRISSTSRRCTRRRSRACCRRFPDSGTFYVDPNTVKTSVGPSGKFDGIGATVASQNGQIIIVAPIENTPAQRAGFKAGDAILEVDGESTEGWTQEKAVLKIRGPRGTTVTLKIRHADGQEETLDIERDEIKVQSVTANRPAVTLKDGSGAAIDDIAYIHIREFSEPTKDEMREGAEGRGRAAASAASSSTCGTIPGGLLNVTADIADEFVDTDKTDPDGAGARRQQASNSSRTAAASRLTIPVVIIMNRFSASGSEVLAAALHDNDRATIIGEKSFGKGTVNISNNLNDGGQLYISIAKWLTPNGTQIDGVGIRPDIAIDAVERRHRPAPRRAAVQGDRRAARNRHDAGRHARTQATPSPVGTPTRAGG